LLIRLVPGRVRLHLTLNGLAAEIKPQVRGCRSPTSTG
jgi:hypothetical protein